MNIIKILRPETNLTQNSIASIIGVTSRTIRSIEKRSIFKCKIITIKKIALLFNISIDYLLSNDIDYMFDKDKIKIVLLSIELRNRFIFDLNVNINLLNSFQKNELSSTFTRNIKFNVTTNYDGNIKKCNYFNKIISHKYQCNLKYIRIKSKLTQKELATMINVSIRTIREIENISNYNCNMITIEKIVLLFNVSIDYLLSNSNNPNIILLSNELRDKFIFELNVDIDLLNLFQSNKLNKLYTKNLSNIGIKYGEVKICSYYKK